jgi:hypothetical protein
MSYEDNPIVRALPSRHPAENESPNVIITGNRGGLTVRFQPREIMVGQTPRTVDPYELMALVKNLTQSIGEYKAMNNAYGDFLVGGLRKTRRDVVAQLESTFRIHWGLDADGNSVFSM